MGFSDFLRGIAAQVNPFDNGKTYGTYNPPRKKRQEEQNPITARPAPLQINRDTTYDVDNPTIQVQKPQNVFGTLNNSRQMPQSPSLSVPVMKSFNTQVAQQPLPGTIVKPNQSLFDKVRDQFDANTEADQWRRQQGNIEKGENKPIKLEAPGNIVSRTPIVGHGVKLLNTLGTEIPRVGITAQSMLAQRELENAYKTGDENRIKGALNRTESLNRQVDAANTMFRNNDGGLFNAGTLYDEKGARTGDIATGVKDIVAPTAITMLDLISLGRGSAIEQMIRQGGWRSLVSGLGARNILGASAANAGSGGIDTAAQGGTINDITKSAAINTVLGLVPDVLLPAGWRVFKNKVRPSVASGGAIDPADIAKEAEDVALSTGAEVGAQVSTPRPITVTKDIPVDAPIVPDQPVNVRVLTQPKPIIKEFPGDATSTTPDALVRRSVQESREQAARDANFQNRLTQDQINASEGITPRKPEEPFVLDQKVATDAQNSLVDDYANQLKSYDDSVKGGQMQKVDDGSYSGTYVRTSEHSKFYRDYYAKNGRPPSKAAWREEAERQLRSGRADSEVQKAYNDAADPQVQSLLAQGEQVDAPIGKPIAVKQVNSIDVIDKTNVPKDLPETPGTVRTTTQADPQAAKTQVAAEQQATLPVVPKLGSTLPDGTKVTKRMVQAARNQRKLARQLAKTQQQTSEAMSQVNATGTSKPLGDNPGIVKSGELKKGKNGVYETAKVADQQSTAVVETSTMSGADIAARARENVKNNGRMSPQDVRDIEDVLYNNPRYKPGDPEYAELSKLYAEDGTAWGQEGAFRKAKIARRTQSGTQISNHTISKLYAYANDPTKITDDMIGSIQKASDEFANLRDAAKKAADDFNGNPTRENYNRFNQLSKQLDKAEKNLARTEYDVAKNALKGNTDIKVKRFVEDAADEADVYTMDFVDSALLSSTGTFVRNFVNAGLSSVEEGAFGGIGSRIGRVTTKGNVGGGIGRGSFAGFGKGVSNIVDASKARFKNAGWNPIGHMKNWSTTGNQLGDSMIGANTMRSVRNHYEKMLKKQGYSGEELRMRADVMARTDPQDLAMDKYAPQARKDAGLGSGISKRSTIEKDAQRWVADQIGDVLGPKSINAAENISKAVTRAFIGFPSAIGRSFVAGSQRILPGVNADTAKIFTAKNADDRAFAIKNSIKKSGTAATIGTVMAGLGASDLVSGPYPDDPNERDRWEREGIKANSIKLGDAWYDIPSYMGSFGVPVVVYSAIGRHGGLNKDALLDIGKSLKDMSPTDTVAKATGALESENNFEKYTQRLASSGARMATPYGSLLNQLSKVFDPTQNDTSGDTWVEGVLNKIVDGIPFLDSKGPFALPDKTDKEGNVLYNPSVAETMVGASGAVQKGGEQRTNEINTQINDKLSTIKSYGAFDDPNFKALLEGEELGSYKKALEGKQLDESDIKQLQSAFVKGVTAGTDTAYLEREQYDTNLTALKMKRDQMKADPTVAPSKLKDIETDIKRGEVYKENQVPYQDISDYKDIGVEEWRKMGIPPGDDDYDPDLYNPEMYQKLWDIDQMMTKAGVSYKKGDLTKNKYYLKEKKSGSGSGSKASKKIGTDFGTLKSPDSAPKVQQYDTIKQQVSGVPIIKKVRPNIVHKITTSR